MPDTSTNVQRVLDDALAVLVLYGQPLAQSATFQSLGANLQALGVRLDLLVYDNSPEPLVAQAADTPGWRVQYIHDASNPGVSRAYLTGAEHATQRAKRWLLFLDQDTQFPVGALTGYVDAIHAHPEVGLFAPVLRASDRVISPCTYRLKRGSPPRQIVPGAQRFAGRSVLNSGMWISLDQYQAIGGHDPRIALDFADHELVDRYKRQYDRFVIVDVHCTHDLSAMSIRSTRSRLQRFRSYCSGARYASRGALDGVFTAGLILARAGLLSFKYRDPRFLPIAFDTLRAWRREP